MDDDSELQEIRARRLAELQKERRGEASASSFGPSSNQNQQQKEREDNELRNNLLTQILSQEARGRCEYHYHHHDVYVMCI